KGDEVVRFATSRVRGGLISYGPDTIDPFRHCVQAERHVEPRADPFAAVNGAGLQRLHNLTARQHYHDSAHPPQHLGAGPSQPVAQAFEPQRRSDLMREPPAHLATGIGAEQRLDVELTAERVPQLLAAAVMDPREQLICGEAIGDCCEELERRGLLYEVTFIRMIHVGDTGAYRFEVFERADKPSGQKNLYFDAPSGRGLDRLCETNCAWVKAGTFGPVGHHLELSYSLRNRGRRENSGGTGGT